MKYKLLKPCIVPQGDGKAAVSYRRYGQEVVVPSKADGDRLVAGGFLEEVHDEPVKAAPKVEPPKEVEPPKVDPPKAK